jgi:trk system potassium uptake protein TrkA
LLEEANVSKTDTIMAVTDDDKTNMLAAVRAKSRGCKKAIALINDPTMSPLMEPLGIDAYINPRSTTVSSILRHIRHGKVKNVYSIGDAEAEVIEAQVMSTSPIAGSRIGDIDFPEGVIVGGILKNEDMVKPSSQSKIEEGDIIALFVLSKDIAEVERLLQVTIDYF